MLFRRQNNPATTVNTQTTPAPAAKQPVSTQATPTTKPLTATRPETGPIRSASTTATPTAPIAQAQQRRLITTPTGNYSMPSANNSAPAGNRKLQVGRDITLQGEIGACDHLVIEGTVKATIKQLQQFDILDHGLFSGSVTADNADINGHFDGDLTVTGRLWLRGNATVTGTIRYGSLQVEKGATLRGTIDTLESTSNKTTATFVANDVGSDNT